ncbi:hypothetical protein, partial [Pseudoalteromonas sp. bablab_jr010]|uniref:hypothetical protein n=1 Tax=Pseudoalteromonas sp. bablab_jr010 TaxID=2755063 RepID=UPI001A7E7AF9
PLDKTRKQHRSASNWRSTSNSTKRIRDASLKRKKKNDPMVPSFSSYSLLFVKIFSALKYLLQNGPLDKTRKQHRSASN